MNVEPQRLDSVKSRISDSISVTNSYESQRVDSQSMHSFIDELAAERKRYQRASSGRGLGNSGGRSTETPNKTVKTSKRKRHPKHRPFRSDITGPIIIVPSSASMGDVSSTTASITEIKEEVAEERRKRRESTKTSSRRRPSERRNKSKAAKARGAVGAGHRGITTADTKAKKRSSTGGQDRSPLKGGNTTGVASEQRGDHDGGPTSSSKKESSRKKSSSRRKDAGATEGSKSKSRKRRRKSLPTTLVTREVSETSLARSFPDLDPPGTQPTDGMYGEIVAPFASAPDAVPAPLLKPPPVLPDEAEVLTDDDALVNEGTPKEQETDRTYLPSSAYSKNSSQGELSQHSESASGSGDSQGSALPGTSLSQLDDGELMKAAPEAGKSLVALLHSSYEALDGSPSNEEGGRAKESTLRSKPPPRLLSESPRRLDKNEKSSDSSIGVSMLQAPSPGTSRSKLHVSGSTISGSPLHSSQSSLQDKPPQPTPKRGGTGRRRSISKVRQSLGDAQPGLRPKNPSPSSLLTTPHVANRRGSMASSSKSSNRSTILSSAPSSDHYLESPPAEEDERESVLPEDNEHEQKRRVELSASELLIETVKALEQIAEESERSQERSRQRKKDAPSVSEEARSTPGRRQSTSTSKSSIPPTPSSGAPSEFEPSTLASTSSSLGASQAMPPPPSAYGSGRTMPPPPSASGSVKTMPPRPSVPGSSKAMPSIRGMKMAAAIHAAMTAEADDIETSTEEDTTRDTERKPRRRNSQAHLELLEKDSDEFRSARLRLEEAAEKGVPSQTDLVMDEIKEVTLRPSAQQVSSLTLSNQQFQNDKKKSARVSASTGGDIEDQETPDSNVAVKDNTKDATETERTFREPTFHGVVMFFRNFFGSMQEESYEAVRGSGAFGEPSRRKCTARTKRLTVGSILVVIVISLVVAIAVSAAQGGNAPTSAPSPMPTFDEDGLQAFLSSLLADGGDAIKIMNTPQNNAFNFIISGSQLSRFTRQQLVQRYALATLYYASGGEHWFDNESWLDTDIDECEWSFSSFGSKSPCDSSGQLTSLSMPNNGLRGSLPPEIRLLNKLEGIDMAANSLSGELPSALSLLPLLRTLNLAQNRYQGTIPAHLGMARGLKTLILSANKFSGPIPTELGQLNQLERLLLANNALSSSIPIQVGELGNLRLLNIRDNNLKGTIPDTLSSLGSLAELDLNLNSLTGTLPSVLGGISSLRALDLGSNPLTGTIPSELWSSSLSLIKLGETNLSGSLSERLGQATTLQVLDLSGNNFGGPIPMQIGRLGRLEHLDLSEDQLSGTIPTELALCTALRSLFLQGNQLSGIVPAAVARLPLLTEHDFSDNEGLQSNGKSREWIPPTKGSKGIGM